MLERTREFVTRTVNQLLRDDAMGLAAELAYRFFLALFPFAIFVAGVGSFIARQLATENPAEQIKDQLTGVLPPEAATLIGAELERLIESQSAGVISFSVIAAIFFATGGTNATIKALNRAFGVEETRPFWKRYVLAIGLTLLAGTALIGAFLLFVVGQVLAGEVAAQVGLREETAQLIGLLRWPAAVVLVIVAVTILYRLGPNLEMRFRWIVPGAILFTIGWLVGTWAFGFYVSNFSSYGATYGALAGVAILLIWFYLTALIVLVGAEVNDVLAEMREPDEVEQRRRANEARGARRVPPTGEERRSGDDRRSGRDRRGRPLGEIPVRPRQASRA